MDFFKLINVKSQSNTIANKKPDLVRDSDGNLLGSLLIALDSSEPLIIPQNTTLHSSVSKDNQIINKIKGKNTFIDKNTLSIQDENTLSIQDENKTLFKMDQVQFRKGDTIRVVRLENSDINQYKGYNGTIKECQGQSAFCTVILDAVNSGAAIRFPKSHLRKWCMYTNTEL